MNFVFRQKIRFIKELKKYIKSLIWFLVGSSLGFFLFVSFAFIVFEQKYKTYVYPGIFVNGVNFSGQSKSQVAKYFSQKNQQIGKTKITFSYQNENITVASGDLGIGYNTNLLAEQAFSIGRSDNLLSNISIVFQAYFNGIDLPASYDFSQSALEKAIKPFKKSLDIPPVNALFTFKDNKVTAFKPARDGQKIDMDRLESEVATVEASITNSQTSKQINIAIPVAKVKPHLTTDKANTLGIKELIGSGTSLYRGSDSNRIYNIALAAQRLNGILVAPNEIFSFDKALGDISAFTGYKEAYVIQNGRTVLGDGGGVCQVSTTFFRALLNAGLPIVERHAHAYRVGYYEEDSPPGLDATIYSPTVDLKFQNDTGSYILIQSVIDPSSNRLTFLLYGKKDGRTVVMTAPVITNQTPPPPALYQDDPNLPKGEIKQVDFAAWGANVYFTRKVYKDRKLIISDNFVSNYQPWRAVYLRGTK
ncbi:VanW family protein [Patescibacteria group bacterium]|nr:VanW family protein [Patescibacteria group bacterium]MCL5010282.1 VanW family protein [Patescibacteria group bacterium]